MTDFSSHFADLKTINSCLSKKDELSKSPEILQLKTALTDSNLSKEDKQKLGQELNIFKKNLEQACNLQIQKIQKLQEQDNFTQFDPTFFASKIQKSEGSIHPINLVTNEIVEIFQSQGFSIADGPLVETQNYCFTSLNMPSYHVARAMQDTFYLKEKDSLNENLVMRTHTSGVQIRYGEKNQPPFRIVSPGQVYRNEKIDATHDIMFHQIEGLVVDKIVSVSELKTILQNMFSQFFNDDSLVIRFRPSYFPYTIPSMEFDISCPFCKGKGCRVCKNAYWIEIGGSGLIHPNVIANMGLNPNEWQGFAFGFGLDRMAQFKFGVSGMSQFFEGSLEFLQGV